MATGLLIEKVESMKPALDKAARHAQYIPKVQYYEGEETIALVYDRINKAKERYFISDMDAIATWMQWTSVEHMVRVFTHTTGFSQEILLDTPLARRYAKAKDVYYKKHRRKKNYAIAFLPVENERCQSDTIYIDGICFHIAYGSHLIGIEINNPIYYQTQKMMFDHLWKMYA
jgi:hypothetical protein